MKKKEREPKYLPNPLNNQMLNYAEYYMSTGEKCLYSLILFAAGAVVGWAFYGGLFKVDGIATIATYISNVVVMCAVGGIAIKIFLSEVQAFLKKRRASALSVQFRDLLESLNTSLSSGSTVADAFTDAPGALLNQYGSDSYIITELNAIISGVANGQTLEVMLNDFGMRSDNEDIQNFANVMANCYRLGGDFKNVVRRTKDIIGDKMAVSSEIATKVASNKFQHSAMCVIPVILVIMLKHMSSMFSENLATPIGVIVTTISVAILTASFFWGRRIVEIN